MQKRVRGRLVAIAGLAAALGTAGWLGAEFLREELAIRRLLSPDENVRDEAARFLGERRVTRAVPVLLQVLEEGQQGSFEEPAENERALRLALERLVIPQSAPRFIEALDAGKPQETRSWAARALGRLDCDSDEVFSALVRALRDDDEQLQAHAAESLIRFGRRAAGVLAEAAFRVPGQSRQWTTTLEELGPLGEGAIPDLLRSLQEQDWYSFQLHEILAGISQDAFEKFIVEGLAQGGEKLRDSIEFDLAANLAGDPDLGVTAKAAVPALLRVLHDARAPVRYAAASCLARISGGPRELLLPVFREMLGDPKERDQAVRLLHDLGWFEVDLAPGLLAVLRDTDSEAREAAAGLLAKAGAAGIPHLKRLLADLDSSPSEEQVDIIFPLVAEGLAGRKELAPLRRSLEAVLSDAESTLRNSAAFLLLFLDPSCPGARRAALESVAEGGQFLPRLVARQPAAWRDLTREWMREDAKAAKQLVEQAFRCQPLTLDLLLEGARSPLEEIHTDSFAGLGFLEFDPGQVPVLSGLLDDPDPELRAWTLHCLGRLGENAAVPTAPLERLLRDSSCRVRREARKALRSVGRGDLASAAALSLCEEESCGQSHAQLGRKEMLWRALEDGTLPATLARLGKDDSREVLSLLSEIGPPARAAVTWIVERLQDPELLWQGARTLAGIDAAGAVPAVVGAALANEDRFTAMAAVACSGPSVEAIPVYLKSLACRHEHLRYRAALDLGRLGPAAAPAAMVLVERLRRLRGARAAAYVLAKIGPSALPALVAGLDGASADARVWIAFTLGHLGSGADGALARLAEDPDDLVRRTVREARERLAGARPPSPLLARPGSYREFVCGTGLREAALDFHETLPCSRKPR